MELGRQVWRDAYYVHCEVLVAYNHEDGKAGAGSSGICTFVFPRVKPFVHSSGVIGVNRAQWIRLSGMPGGDIAILNVYVPNLPSECMSLWDELILSLLQNCRWIIGGDWNMVTEVEDNSNPTGHVASEAEKMEFARLTSHLQVIDFFQRSRPLVYTWDNKRRVGTQTLKRLDRFFCYENPCGPPNSHIKKYYILGDSQLSDHLPVQLQLELQATQLTGSRYKMNGYYLKDKNVVAQLIDTWKCLPLTLNFFGKLRRITKWYKEICLQKAKAKKATEATLCHRMVGAHECLQTTPHCPDAQERLATISDSLRNFEEWRVSRQCVRSCVKWRACGDKGSKEFFTSVRMRNSQSHVTELFDSSGVAHTSQTKLQEIYEAFYFLLYTGRPSHPAFEAQQQWVFEGLSSRLSPNMLRTLDRPLTLSELNAALGGMANEKSPGLDGVITEMYKCLWPTIGEEYLEMLNLSILGGSLPPSTTKGLLVLLHKGGCRKSLNN
jgi:hypothetical protein